MPFKSIVVSEVGVPSKPYCRCPFCGIMSFLCKFAILGIHVSFSFLKYMAFCLVGWGKLYRTRWRGSLIRDS